MKWLGDFHPFTKINPSVINRFTFGQGVVIYYICEQQRYCDNAHPQSMISASVVRHLVSFCLFVFVLF